MLNSGLNMASPSPRVGQLCDNMKHPNRGTECFEFNLSKALGQRCVHSRYTVCGGCESCILTKRTTSVKTWFSKAGDRSRRRFMLGLIRRLHSADLVCHVIQLLQPLLYKDFTYARTRTKPSLSTDQATTSDDRALSLITLEQDITNTWYWFETTNYWTKCNFLLAIMQDCEAHLLHAIGTLAKTLYASEHSVAIPVSDDIASVASTNYTFTSTEHPELELLISARSGYSILDKFPLQSPRNKQVNFTPEQGVVNEDDDVSVNLDELDPTCMVVPTSEKAYSGVSRHKDFIRQLPVHLSKYILSWLDQVSLYNCVCVSRHWRILVEEVHNEFYVNQHLWEEVMLMQGAAGQSSNPLYAKDTDVYVPNVIPATWQTIKTGESMIETMFKSEVNFMTAYSGYSTRKIIMEERNVYCGAYNVMMLMDQEQASETTAMDTDGGKLIAFGCLDRKIHFLCSNTGKPLDKAISGHAGSIRCLAINEKKGIIVSGSYDTSLRGWSLETGRCEKIYRGHNDTITCVQICGDKMASGARDNLCKIWHLETGQCERTFKHKHAISAIAFSVELCISGCDNGSVTVWDVKTGQIVKKLTGHHNVVTGIRFDQWHIVTGSKDGYALAWSAQGDHTRCLTALRHTREVLCLEFMYLRVITGSADGKLRIWNMLNGQCLRIMRGNSKSDPIYRFVAIGNRITVNTSTNMLMLHFEQVEYDYTLENDKTPALVQYSKYSETPIRPQPYSYIRAQRMLKAGASNTKIVHHTLEGEGVTTELTPRRTPKRHDQMTHSAKGLSSHNMASAQRIHSAGARLQTSARQTDRRPLTSDTQLTPVKVSAKSVTISARPTPPSGHPRRVPQTSHSSMACGIHDNDQSSEDGSRSDTRRRVSWAFEHPRIPRTKKYSLKQVKSLLRSQMRIRGKPVPPDFVYLSINAIQASMRPTEATANMQVVKREEELRFNRHLGRPMSSPGMIDPRTKVPPKELLLDPVMLEHSHITPKPADEKLDDDITEYKPSQANRGAEGKGRVKVGDAPPVAAIIDTEYRSTPVTTRPHMSLYKKSVPSSIPKARVLRPHTATLRCPTPEPGEATTRMLRKAKQASLRSSLSSRVEAQQPRRKPRPVQISPDATMVPMLIYSPSLSARIEDLRQHQRKRQEALLVSPDGNGKVSKYNDPMRSHVTFTLRTHQQVEQELVAIATRRDLDERKNARRLEKQQRAAWLAKVKGCDVCQFTQTSRSYTPEIGEVA